MTEDENNEIQEDLKIQDESQEYKEKYLRVLADMENVRKRMQREKEESARFAIESFILDILGPIDNLENALKFAHLGSEETRNWALGFQMIIDQFKDVLHQHDIKSFSSEGKAFNPHEHEAVEIEETDETPPGIVLKEFSKGYRSKKGILRPAKVKVSKIKN